MLLFDYWKDPLSGSDKDNPPLLSLLDRGKPIFIFVSHHHKDHFSRRIFLWQQRFPGIQYIISKDVRKAVNYMLKEDSTYAGFKPAKESVHILSPGDSFKDSLINIKAYPSTDIGNSYVVECDGMRFFHAGDLNAWLWIDESTDKEISEARTQYIEILDSIRSDYEEFTLVMFPVDSRLGTEYYWGARYFVHKFRCDLFVPMHFELVMDERDKEKRRLDAGVFEKYANTTYGDYLQLSATRSSYMKG